MGKQNEEIEQLVRLLVPINGLSTAQQDQLLKEAEVLQFRKKDIVFKQGSRDNFSYYLLEGTIEMYADDQLIKQVEGGTGQAFHPLAQLQPRQMSGKAKTNVTVLRINRLLLDKLLSLGNEPPPETGIEATEIDVQGIDGGDMDWLASVLQSELFSRIPPSNIQKLLSTMEPVTYRAGEAVVRQDDPGDYYYIIKQGRCEVTRKTSAGGHEIRLAELAPGTGFGEEALVSESKRNASVKMMTDGELVRLTKDDFVDLIKKPLLKAITYDQAKDLAKGGAIWLDVRFPEEHRESNITASVNIPLNVLRTQAEKLDPARRYLAYCDSGSRSSVAAFLLSERGFDAYYIGGGCMRHLVAATPPKPAATTVAPTAKKKTASRPEIPSTGEPPPKPSTTEDTIEADIRAESLKAELAKATLALEEARRLKAEADSARAAAEKAMQEKLRADQERLAEARRLKAEADSARAAAEKAMQEKLRADQEKLAEAQRLKAEAEAAKLAAEKALEEKLHIEQEELEAAQHLKAEAEAAKLAAEKALEEKLRAERDKLDAEARKAAAILAEAKRLRDEIEVQKQAADSEAERLRREQEERLLRLQAEAEHRLREERSRLEESYRKKAEELETIQSTKAEAEKLLAADRKRLEKQSAETRKMLESARRNLLDQQEKEKKLREASQLQLAEERRKLEAEFARNAAMLELAQREKTAAEAARRAAAEEAEVIIAEYRSTHDQMRAQEEARLREERRVLEMERERLRAAAEEAKKIREEAESLKRRTEEQAAHARAQQTVMPTQVADTAAVKLRTEIDAIEAQAAAATKRLRDAIIIEEKLEREQVANDQRLEYTFDQHDQLRKQLEQELDEWITEQEKKQSSTAGREVIAHISTQTERIKQKAEKAKHEARSHDESLLEELASLLKN